MTHVGATALAVARRWPTLLAWFLAGWLARMLLLRLAGHLGNEDAVYGLLVLPLAVLARLISYVAIFLVVRDALASRRPADDPPLGGWSRLRLGTRHLGESVLDAIIPFFVIYAAWSLIDEDVVAYARASLDLDQTAAQALSVSFGALSVSMVVLAFGLRLLLTRLEDRLPRWTSAITVYLEAVWVLVSVLVLSTLLAKVPEWLASRRMFSWLLDRLDDLRDSFGWLGTVVDGLGPAWSLVSDVVLLPLAWLALAGVVFSGLLADREVGREPHHVSRLRGRFALLPRRWRRLADLATRAVVERWEPIRRIAMVVWRAGPAPIGAYLLAFAVLQSSTSWLDMATSHVAGPHEQGWWMGTAATIDLAIDTLVVPLQLALVAWALFHLSSLAQRRRPAPTSVLAGSAPGA